MSSARYAGLPRRDKCLLVGRRAGRCSDAEAVLAWRSLARQLEDMGGLDVPKFNNLIIAVNLAALSSKPAVRAVWNEWKQNAKKETQTNENRT